jgi:hypothetical protein
VPAPCAQGGAAAGCVASLEALRLFRLLSEQSRLQCCTVACKSGLLVLGFLGIPLFIEGIAEFVLVLILAPLVR